MPGSCDLRLSAAHTVSGAVGTDGSGQEGQLAASAPRNAAMAEPRTAPRLPRSSPRLGRAPPGTPRSGQRRSGRRGPGPRVGTASRARCGGPVDGRGLPEPLGIGASRRPRGRPVRSGLPRGSPATTDRRRIPRREAPPRREGRAPLRGGPELRTRHRGSKVTRPARHLDPGKERRRTAPRRTYRGHPRGRGHGAPGAPPTPQRPQSPTDRNRRRAAARYRPAPGRRPLPRLALR